MLFSPVKPNREMDDDDMAAVWRAIDWERLEDILLSMQQDLSYAAYNREWDRVDRLQHQLVNSWTARALAIREMLRRSISPGVDGVRWTTDAQKACAVQSLVSRPLPYLYIPFPEYEN